MNWSEEQLAEYNRKTAAVSALAAGVAPFITREGRIKGVAAAADRQYNGRQYMSKSEMEFAMHLDLLQRAGAITSWTPQVSKLITLNGVPICKVVIDFEAINPDGSIVYYEVKGFATDIYRLKRKLLLACYPGINYTLVKVGQK